MQFVSLTFQYFSHLSILSLSTISVFALLKMSQPPENFAASIKDFESWPENLVHQTTCLGVLKGHKTRLDATEPKLFTQETEDINVSFLELIESGLSALISLAPEL